MGVHSKIVTDHIGVHSQKQKEPHGSAFVSDRDQMGVHSIFVIRTTWDCTPNANLRLVQRGVQTKNFEVRFSVMLLRIHDDSYLDRLRIY